LEHGSNAEMGILKVEKSMGKYFSDQRTPSSGIYTVFHEPRGIISAIFSARPL
jgi:hypothetical protein